MAGGRPAKPSKTNNSTLALVDQDILEASRFEWVKYREWVWSKYHENSAVSIWYYSRKYHQLMTNNRVRELDLLPDTIKNNVVKSLVVLSKYLGVHEQFKQNLKNHGVKPAKHNATKSFLRILKASNSNILAWYKKAYSNVREHEKTYLKFLLLSGIRKQEAIDSFNKIIELSNNGGLGEYYDRDLNCLMHFKYPKLFLRNTKNVFISFITEDLLNEIGNSKQITYHMITKRLNRKHMKIRFNELRDYHGTYLLNNGVKQIEIDLLQGRIPVKIFIRHYWSPSLKELGDRTLEATKQLEQIS